MRENPLLPLLWNKEALLQVPVISLKLVRDDGIQSKQPFICPTKELEVSGPWGHHQPLMVQTSLMWDLHSPPLPMSQHPHLSSGLGLCSLPELCCRCTCLQPCLWALSPGLSYAVGSLSPGKTLHIYAVACIQPCLWTCVLSVLWTHAVGLSPALTFKLLDGASPLHRAWDCQQTLLPAPSSACGTVLHRWGHCLRWGHPFLLACLSCWPLLCPDKRLVHSDCRNRFKNQWKQY